MSNTPDIDPTLEMAATALADAWDTERELAEEDPEFELTPHADWGVTELLDEINSQAMSYWEDGIRTSDDAYGLAYCLTLIENRSLLTGFWVVVQDRANAIYATMAN